MLHARIEITSNINSLKYTKCDINWYATSALQAEQRQ